MDSLLLYMNCLRRRLRVRHSSVDIVICSPLTTLSGRYHTYAVRTSQSDINIPLLAAHTQVLLYELVSYEYVLIFFVDETAMNGLGVLGGDGCSQRSNP